MKRLLVLLPLACLVAVSAHARDGRSDGSNYYEITVTNVTRGQSFTPILVATHKPGVRVFTAGQAASAELAALAEGGDTAPLTALLTANPDVHEVTTVPGLLDPGKSVTTRIRTNGKFDHLSLAAMLIPTNDGFIALNGVEGPKGKRALTIDVPAYDAGSEPNDEQCVSIPGPVCGGAGISPDVGGEGFVHVHAGIHGIGSLVPADRDWRNPVAEISIRRVD